jgi:hypothetical protein
MKVHPQPSGRDALWTTACGDALTLLGGYWFSHECYNLLGSSELAARAVYSCTVEFPNIGLLMFDPAYFSQDYAEQLGLREPFKKPRLHSVSTWRVVETSSKGPCLSGNVPSKCDTGDVVGCGPQMGTLPENILRYTAD